MDKPTSKSSNLTPKDENFLDSFRKNYDRIKDKPDFPNYSLKYYNTMKAAGIPIDVYADNVVLRNELKKLKAELEKKSKLTMLPEELDKKENDIKNVVADIYTSVKGNVVTFHDNAIRDHKEQIKTILNTLTVTQNNIQKICPESTVESIKKYFTLLDQEIRLLAKKDWITKRFEEFRKINSSSFNKILHKAFETKDVADITELTRMKMSFLNVSKTATKKDSNALANQSRDGSASTKEVFKIPSFPIPKGRKSIVNISNHMLNVSDCDKSKVDEDFTDASDAESDQDTKHKKTIGNSKAPRIEKVDNIPLPTENTFLKHINYQSTTKTATSEKEIEVREHLPSDDSFNKDIVIESSKICFLKPKKELPEKDLPKKELPKKDIQKKDLQKKELPKKAASDLPSENTFKKNIHYESTKISNSPLDKGVAIQKKKSDPAIVPSPEIAEAAKLPSEMTFQKFIKYESTKIDNASVKKSDSKNADSNECFQTLPSEITFNENVFNESTKLSDHSDSNSSNNVECLNNSGNKNDASIKEVSKSMDIKEAQVTARRNRKTISLSMIEEISEPSKSDSSNSIVDKTSTVSSKESFERKISTLGLKNEDEIENDDKNEKVSCITKKYSDENKENVVDSNAITIQSVEILDETLEKYKRDIMFGVSKYIKKLESTQINIAETSNELTTNDCIFKNPWTGAVRTKIWSEYLPKLLASSMVKQINADITSSVVFDTKKGDQEFSLKTLLYSNAFFDVYVGRCMVLPNDYIIKIRKSNQCLEHYFLLYAQLSLKDHANDKSGLWEIDILPSICTILSLTLSNTKSYMLMPHHRKGTLNDLCRTLHECQLTRREVELVTAYIAMELLTIVFTLHIKVKLLHCNIRPANIAINELFPVFSAENGVEFKRTGVIMLTDFHDALCLKKYPKKCKFSTDDRDLSERCIETKLGMPWCYEIDLFNVATCLYFLLQDNFPCVTNFENRRVFSTMTRFSLLRAGNVWLNLFNFLLNFESTSYNEIMVFVEAFKHLIKDHIADYNRCAEKINNILRTEQ